MLGLEHRTLKWWTLCAPLAHYGRDGIAVFFLEPSDEQDYDITDPEKSFWRYNSDGWLSDERDQWVKTEREGPSVEIIAGSYRQSLDHVSTYIQPRQCSAPTESSDTNDAEEPGEDLPWQAIILCPGDRLRYNFRVSKEGMVIFNNGGRYRLSLKNHFCNFWKEVTDAEVQSSQVRVYAPATWPDCGPIYLDTVSEVALTLERIFEREKPQPFHRLPRDLREQIYGYLRYKEGAKYVDFMVKP